MRPRAPLQFLNRWFVDPLSRVNEFLTLSGAQTSNTGRRHDDTQQSPRRWLRAHRVVWRSLFTVDFGGIGMIIETRS
jgi:hypothetical protein